MNGRNTFSRRKAITGLLCATSVLSAAALVSPSQAAAASAAASSGEKAPVVVPDGGAIAGQYIVVLKAPAAGAGAAGSAVAAADPVLDHAKDLGVDIDRQYTNALNGFAAELDPSQLAALRTDPGVEYIAQDGAVKLAATQPTPPSWGLDRLDQSALPLDSSYSYDDTGDTVTAYVLDTGIRITHTDFGGRASGGFTAIGDGNGSNDCNGHGTHVAGTIGGATYGVAKQVDLVAVRVLGCSGSGSWSGVIDGIDWVTAHHSGPSVANMSLAGGLYQPTNDAVTASIASGVTYALAAANAADNACNWSPASTPEAITVGATVIDDSRAGFSNYGPCLDLFAPGQDITSAWIGSDTDSVTISGTSMASPHVAGAAALYLEDHPTASPGTVATALLAATVADKVTDPGTGSPNKLLQTKATAPVPAALKAQLANRDYDPNDGSLKPVLKLVNTGTSSVDLSKVTVRYWFTKEGGAGTFGTACDYAPIGCAKVTTKVTKLGSARPKADAYLEVGFTSTAGSLAPSASTGDIQLRVNKTDWSPFLETDDFSYLSPSWAPVDAVKVTVQVDGTTVWGSEPPVS